MDFVHLHNHSDYSTYDGFQTIEQMVKRDVDCKMNAIAITDHGKVGGLLKFYKECKKNNIKPILGSEFYITNDLNSKKSQSYHLVVIAKNNIGYKNLIKLSSESHKYISRFQPRIDFDMLLKYKDGLIVSSACLGGEVASAILNGNIDNAIDVAKKYKDNFGNDYYLEIMYHGQDDNGLKEKQQKVMAGVVDISKKLGIDVIVTNDAHYATKDMYKYQQVKKTISNQKPLEYKDSDQYYLKTKEEMYGLYTHPMMKKIIGCDGETYLNNTVKLAEKCNVEIEYGMAKLPEFNIPVNDTDYVEFKKNLYGMNEEQMYLRYLSFKGLKWRGLEGKKEYIDRIDIELETIKFTGFERYFLIVSEYCEFARSKNILVGVGRGCFLPDSNVLCENGCKNIQDIKKGDVVLSHDGTYNEVLEKFVYDVDEDILEIEVEDGRIIKCTKNHEIRCIVDGVEKWVEAKDLQEGYDIVDLCM